MSKPKDEHDAPEVKRNWKPFEYKIIETCFTLLTNLWMDVIKLDQNEKRDRETGNESANWKKWNNSKSKCT